MTTRASQPPSVPDRAALPDAPLRGRVLAAFALGWVAVASLGLAIHAWLDTSPAQPMTATAVFTVMMALVLATMRDHHPFPQFGAANQVTLGRGVLVALTTSLLAVPPSASVAWPVVITALVIAALDGLDGWLARRSQMTSPFGARFDMEMDAFFIFVLSILVWRHGKAGLWVLAIGLMRYIFVAAGWLLPPLARPLRPTLRGKTMAIVALVALGIGLAPPVPAAVSSLVCGVALAALTWSFLVDVRFLWRQKPDEHLPSRGSE